MRSPRSVVAALASGAVVAGLLTAGPAAAQAAPGPVVLEALSNRADLVSGGDVLLGVRLPAGSEPARLRVAVDGRDVSAAFRLDGPGRAVGLVEGLKVGGNVVTARLGRDPGASLTVTNHPAEGPVFSGPQLQPWLCTTVENGLAPSTLPGCSAPSTRSLFYKPATGGAIAPYTSTVPAAAVAQVTVAGKAVPFIVQRERGTMNRGIYDVAGLWDPAAPGAEATWNGKLLYAFGASSATVHSQGPPAAITSVLVEHALVSGYMVATNSLNTRGHSQNPVVSAESVMMLKEHITETYGEIRFTMGQGGSGGAIGQQMVANSYPGLLDGIQPALSFPDGSTTGTEVADCVNLNRYYTANAAEWTPAARAAVNGHLDPGPCSSWQAAFGGLLDPVGGCGPAVDGTPLAYDAVRNPRGVRCAGQDYEKNIWGVDAQGKGNSIYGNTGVQYGLEALAAGEITPAQFADLNAEIGSFDKDYVSRPARSQADPFAVATAYRAGQINDFGQADKVAIIDLRPPDNSGIHTDYHSDEVRARLVAANGTADNQVIWRAPALTPTVVLQSFGVMDAWLTAVDADVRPVTLESKVRDNKPAPAVDACFVNDVKTVDAAVCATNHPVYELPRMIAGGPDTHDVPACQLQPLSRSAYGAVAFTDAEWTRIQSAFPGGVCDWSKPAASFQPSVPWTGFTGGPGGQALPAAPTSSPTAALPKADLFSDVRLGADFFDDIEYVVERRIAVGRADGTFRSGDAATRGQMAAFLYRSAGEPAVALPTTPSFVDVPAGSTFYREVEWARSEGIALGTPVATGSAYRPQDRVTREHMAALLLRMSGAAFTAPTTATFSDVPVGSAYFREVEWTASTGISRGYGDGTFGPGAGVLRGQVAAFLRRALEADLLG